MLEIQIMHKLSLGETTQGKGLPRVCQLAYVHFSSSMHFCVPKLIHLFLIHSVNLAERNISQHYQSKTFIYKRSSWQANTSHKYEG